MPKAKLSFTLEDDAVAMLKQTAEALGEPVSRIAERAIRHFCIDYAPHRLQLSVAEGGGVAVYVERQGRTYYARRPVARGHSHGTRGVVTINTNGPLTTDGVLRALASPTWTPDQIRNGERLDFEHEGYKCSLNHLRVENPGFVQRLLEEMAQAVRDAQALSIRQVFTLRCPKCGSSVIEVREWSPPGGTTECEWICNLGHHIDVP